MTFFSMLLYCWMGAPLITYAPIKAIPLKSVPCPASGWKNDQSGGGGGHLSSNLSLYKGRCQNSPRKDDKNMLGNIGNLFVKCTGY